MERTGRADRRPMCRSGGPRGSRRALPIAPLAALLAVLAIGGVSAGHPAGALAPATLSAVPHPAGSLGAQVLAINQTKNITAQGTFTVSMEYAAPANVSLAYFLFCELSSAKCFSPIKMAQQNDTDWFSGTTNPMPSYPGMTAGAVAGYNISIDLMNGTNFTEPILPNAFPSLTINSTSTGENMFQLVVRSQLFTIGGVVSNGTSGAAISGATVTLSPGGNTSTTNSQGEYSFVNLANGSYNISVDQPGFQEYRQSVVIHGTDQTQNVPLAAVGSKTSPTNPSGGSHSSGSSSPWSGTTLYALVGLLVVAAVGLALWATRRRGRAGPPAAPGPTDPAPTEGTGSASPADPPKGPS